MGKKGGIVLSILVLVLALFLSAIANGQKQWAWLHTLSMLSAGAVGCFNLARYICSVRKPATSTPPDTRTPQQRKADADAHTQTVEDMYAQGGG